MRRVQIQALGDARDGPRRRPPERLPVQRPSRPAQLAFREDAEAAGLRFTFQNGETLIRQLPVTMGGGLGLLDYDGDGWLDVYCVQGGPFPPGQGRTSPGDRLFRNRGDGRFEDVSESSKIAAMPRGYGHGVAVGDHNGGRRAAPFPPPHGAPAP